MATKDPGLWSKLSDDEKSSLKKLCGCGCGCVRDIPDDHAVKFLGLGLVEINWGGVSATRAGRHITVRQAAH